MDNVRINAKEKSAMLEASFEPLAEDDGVLWEKNGVCYGREAALQEALRQLREEGGASRFGGA
jgi:hypothetical protein